MPRGVYQRKPKSGQTFATATAPKPAPAKKPAPKMAAKPAAPFNPIPVNEIGHKFSILQAQLNNLAGARTMAGGELLERLGRSIESVLDRMDTLCEQLVPLPDKPVEVKTEEPENTHSAVPPLPPIISSPIPVPPAAIPEMPH